MTTPLRRPALAIAVAVLASCASSPAPVRVATQQRPAPPPPAVTANEPAAPRPPPPVVRVAMQGEPADASLSEARLVASSCEQNHDLVEARVKAMRDEVAAELKRWHDAQPDCWAEYRRREEEAKARAAGSYGLGLSGIGYGGGGAGEGIGLGSIGTIGHGAGTGSVRMGATATSRSDTNNQVKGVDEADLVKSDGRYVYFAANGALRIAEAMSPKIISVTKLPGAVRELFVEGNRAVVYASTGDYQKRCTYGYDCIFAGDGSSTRVTVLDISNRAEPKAVRTIELSGSLIASRRIGNAVHTVVADGDSPQPSYITWPSHLETCGTNEESVKAKFARLVAENEKKIRASDKLPTMRDGGVDRPLCGGLMKTAFADGRAFTTVVSFDLADDKAAPTTATIQSRPGAVFASADGLYLTVGHRKASANGRWYSFYPSVDEASEVHKFHIGSAASATRYAGSGVVPGHVLNQFAMDEWNGYLRVATTSGKVPDPKVSSSVSIFTESDGHNLVRVGAIQGIAPGEDIRAVRFEEDRGYIVTFKKTDPLFVIDLYDAAHPAVLGELKIPGFSTYMHRIDADHLLSIGLDANDHGDFAYFDGVILQLFDVKNPTEPKLLHKEKIGTRGSSSEALTDHLAFNYFADKGLLAIPMTTCEGGGDGTFGTQVSFSGLLVYGVSVERGFTKLGGVDHGGHGVSCNTWWSNASSAVKRSLFLDDLVYSIATDRVKVQSMNHFGVDVADLSLM